MTYCGGTSFGLAGLRGTTLPVPSLRERHVERVDEVVKRDCAGDVQVGRESRNSVTETKLDGGSALHRSAGEHLADDGVRDHGPHADVAVTVALCDSLQRLVEVRPAVGPVHASVPNSAERASPSVLVM